MAAALYRIAGASQVGYQDVHYLHLSHAVGGKVTQDSIHYCRNICPSQQVSISSAGVSSASVSTPDSDLCRRFPQDGG